MKSISNLRARLKYIYLILLFPFLLGAQQQKNYHIKEMLREKWHTDTHPFQALPHDQGTQTRSSQEYRFTDLEDRSRSEGEPFIAVNPNDSNHIVVSFMDLGFQLDFPVFFSLDGGDNWERSLVNVMDTFKADFPDLIVGGGGDPVLAFDASGRLYFTWIYLGIEFGTGTVVTYWAWSDNQGRDFQLAKGSHRYIEFGKINLFTAEILNEGKGIFDRPWLAVDRSQGPHQGTLYCSGLFLPSDSANIEGKGLVLRIKRPGIDSFELTQTQISIGVNAQFSNVVIDPGGRVHVSYIELDSNKLMHALLKPGGTNILSLDSVASVVGFSPITVHARENPAPSMVIDPSNFNIFLAWGDFSSDLAAGYFSKSIDFGRTWSDPLLLNNIFEDEIEQVLMPVLAINSHGELVLTWFGLDAEDKGFYTTSQSVDGGDSWASPSMVSLDTTDFSTYTDSTFFGDYYKTEYVNQTAYIVWSDGRNELGAKAYFAKLDPSNPTVGISDVNSIQDHTRIGEVFPTPGSGQLFIDIQTELPQLFKMQIFSNEGKLVSHWIENVNAGQSRIKISFNGPPGSYILLAKSELMTATRRIVRQ
jgi:hypothetical protein